MLVENSKHYTNPQKLIAGSRRKKIVSLEWKSGERNRLRGHLHFHLNQTFLSVASLIDTSQVLEIYFIMFSAPVH